jgi:ribosomal protein L29
MKAVNKRVMIMVKTVSEQHSNEAVREQKEELIPLQFKMPRSWVREFKLTAADKEMKLNELLKECFHEYMKAANK